MNAIKKLFVGCAYAVIGAACLFAGNATKLDAASSTSWNFKNSSFKSLGTIKSNKTVDNLTLLANSNKTMQVKSNTVKVSGTSYTHCLALGGGGNTSYRSIKVPVSGSSTIKVTLDASASRTLVLANSSGSKVGSVSATTTAATKSMSYNGGSGFVYLYSSNSNINLYKIQVDSNSGSSSGGSSSGGSSSSGSSSSGSSSSGSSSSSGNTITVKNGGTSLSSAISKAKKGYTIIIDGTVKSGAVKVPSGVNIKGTNNGTIDFSSTSGSSGRGLTFNGSGSTVSYLTVKNASDNGIYIEGSNNTFKYVNATRNHDAGFQISNGGANNKFYNCNSTYNADAKGENADGFACKLHSGTGNYFESCKAEYNSDDGWDLYAAHGAVKIVNCQANYNGYCDGIYGDGNGFKMGGVDNKTSGVKAHLDPLNHELTNCIAKGNYASGFDRNNQSGVVTMNNCTGDSNKKNNYNWPAKGKPSALGYEVTFGKAIINSCTSKNGKNNISGATLKGNCVGF